MDNTINFCLTLRPRCVQSRFLRRYQKSKKHHKNPKRGNSLAKKAACFEWSGLGWFCLGTTRQKRPLYFGGWPPFFDLRLTQWMRSPLMRPLKITVDHGNIVQEMPEQGTSAYQRGRARERGTRARIPWICFFQMSARRSNWLTS